MDNSKLLSNRSPVMGKSSTQEGVTLSLSKAKLLSFVWQLMQAMELKVELSMIIQCKNKVQLTYPKTWVWVGHGTYLWMYMLHDLNKQKLIQVIWVDGNKNPSDLGTKNLDAASHKKHIKTLSGNNHKFQLVSKWGRVLHDNRVGI